MGSIAWTVLHRMEKGPRAGVQQFIFTQLPCFLGRITAHLRLENVPASWKVILQTQSWVTIHAFTDCAQRNVQTWLVFDSSVGKPGWDRRPLVWLAFRCDGFAFVGEFAVVLRTVELRFHHGELGFLQKILVVRIYRNPNDVVLNSSPVVLGVVLTPLSHVGVERSVAQHATWNRAPKSRS